VLLHATILWIAVAALRAAALSTRAPRRWPVRISAAASTLAGAAAAVGVAHRVMPPAPPLPIAIAFGAAAAAAVALGRITPRLNHTSQATRLFVSFVAF